MNSSFDSICDAFEKSFEAGQSPEIVEFLKRGDEEFRTELLCELIQIELWWRRADAPPPTEEHFVEQFQNDRDVVREAFRLYTERASSPAALQATQLQSYAAYLASTVIQSESSREPPRGGAPHGTGGSRPMPPIVTALDADQDGVLSAKEIKNAAGSLQSLDRNEDGKLDMTELMPEPPGGARELSTSSNERFGRYKLLRELGRGGMGTVYLAHDGMLDRKVALKVPTFRESVREEMLTRFYREARAAAVLRDPGICPVYDVGEIDGQAFIAMAFIEGRPLRDYTRQQKPQEAKKTARIIRKLAQAMSEAHDAGIVHRDLKPGNIMMEKGRRPVIMDFGLAYSTTEMESRLTGTGAILGTPTYMSPEQAMGDTENIGPATDIYSLGVICYEMLAGCVPFEGNVTAVLTKIATQEPKPLREYGLSIGAKLEAIVSRMMARKASDRYESMNAVVTALTEYLQEDSSESESLEAGPTGPDQASPRSRSLQPLSEAAGSSDAGSGNATLVGSTMANVEQTRGPDASRTDSRKGKQKQRTPALVPDQDVYDNADADEKEDVDSASPRHSLRHNQGGRRTKKGNQQRLSPALYIGGGAALLVVPLTLWLVFFRSDTLAPDPEVVKNQPADAKAQSTTVADTEPGEGASSSTDGVPETAMSDSTGADGPESRPDQTTPPAVHPVTIAESKNPDSKPEPKPERPLVKVFDETTRGQLAPLEVRTAPRPDYLPKFRFPPKRGQPLSAWALVSRPAHVDKVLSWSIEPRRSRVNTNWMDVSRDGLIAASFDDGRVRLYDADLRLIRIHAEHANSIGFLSESLAFSPDGAWLAAACTGLTLEDAARPGSGETPGGILIWDVRSGQRVYEYPQSLNNDPIRWSPDSSVLAVGDMAGRITFHELQTGQVTEFKPSSVGENKWGTSIAWSPAGDRLAAFYYHHLGDDHKVLVLDVQTMQPLREIPLASTGPNGRVVDWSADGRWLAFADKEQVRIHETENYTLEQTIPQPTVRWLQFSPDSTQLLCMSDQSAAIPGLDEPARTAAYDTKTWHPLASDATVVDGLHSEWLSDSSQIVSHNRIVDWLKWWGGTALSATVSEDGSRLVTGSYFSNTNSEDLLIEIWDGESGQLLNAFHLDCQLSDSLFKLSWQPRGTQIAAHILRNGTHTEALRLLDSAAGKVTQTLEGHTGKIWNTTWSPDGKQLASVGEDATCRLWDAETGQELAVLRHTKEQCWLTWSADGRHIACASPFSDITVWDAKQHERLGEFKTLKNTFGQPKTYGGGFWCPFDFLKDSNLLMVMDGSSGLEICNLKSGAVVDAGKAEGSELGNRNGIQWPPDFKTMLAGGGGNNHLRLYVAGQQDSRRIRHVSNPHWLADSRRIVNGSEQFAPMTGYDTATGRRLGVLLNMAYSPESFEWAMIGPDGNYTSSPGATEYLAVTAILEDGRCVTLTLEEFEQQYGWKNAPDKARFLSRN